MKNLVLSLLTAGLMAGCMLESYPVGPGDIARPSKTVTHVFFFGGALQTKYVDAAKICGDASKVDRVEVEFTAGNIAATVLTLGLVMPRTARVYCAP